MKTPEQMQARFVILVLAVLLAAGGAVRLWTASRIPAIETDGAFYGRLAQIALADTTSPRSAPFPAFHHPVWPGFYPFLTATMVRVLHPGAPTEVLADPRIVERAARGVSVLLGTLLVIPVFLLARRAAGDATALFAAALVAFHPRLIYESGQALTEIPFAFLVLVALAALGAGLDSWKKGTSTDAARSGPPVAAGTAAAALIAGLALGGAALTRPEGIVLVPTAALALLLPGTGPPLRRLGSAALLAAAAWGAIALFAGPAAGFDPASVLSPMKRWYNTAIAWAGATGVPAIDASRSLYNNMPGGDPVPRFDFVAFAAAHPLPLLTHAARELPSSLGAVFSLAYAPFALLAVVGVVLRRRRWTRAEAAWLLFWAAFVAMYALVFVYRRFFTAFLPLLLVEAAVPLAAIAVRRRALAILALLVLLAPGPWSVAHQIRKEEYAPELREAGLALARSNRGAPIENLLEDPGILARKPVAAFYAGRPIRAFPRSGPAELSREMAERGAGAAVVDERLLARERPEWSAPFHGSLPPGLAPAGTFGAAPHRALVLVPGPAGAAAPGAEP